MLSAGLEEARKQAVDHPALIDDVRASGTDKPMKLTYKAKVFQNTGINWEGVKLRLSTNTPNQSLSRPNLPAWYLQYYQPTAVTLSGTTTTSRKKPSMARAYAESYKDVTTDDHEMNEELEAMPMAQQAFNYSSMVSAMTNVEFDIQLPYNIDSDGKHHMVAVQTHDITSEYVHIVVPKVEKQAFLLARLTDWNSMDLLPGQANLYFEGSYIGKTMLNPNVMSDTLDLALGRDRSIVVKRTKVKDEEKPKLIGSERIKTVEYAITLKNNRASAISLIVEDQIPLSNMEEVKVELLDDGKAGHNEGTGLLTWDVKLESRATKKLSFSYSVEYDKDRPLLGQL